jgi:AcrR family transcriptional regulator
MLGPQRGRRSYHLGHVRAALLREVALLVREAGFEGLSLRNLSQRTGVALGSLYHHFRSKDDLLSVLAVEGFSRLRRDLVQAASDAPTRPVFACVEAYLAFFERDPQIYFLMFSRALSEIDLVKSGRDAAFQVFEVTIANSAAGKTAGEENVRAVASAVWTSLHGAAVLDGGDGRSGDIAALTKRGLEEMFRGLRAIYPCPDAVQEK